MPTLKNTRKRVPKKKKADIPPRNPLNPRYNVPNDELTLEHTVSRIILLRFEQDIARLFSTHIHHIALNEVPRLINHALMMTTPGWVAVNAASDEVKDFFRGALAMDMRQAGERVSTKSILWSYAAIRQFAISHDVPLCNHRGLHSHLLVPHHAHMRHHLKTLERLPPPKFANPPHLGSTVRGLKSLEKQCASRVKGLGVSLPRSWEHWELKIREGYLRLVETLWEVADEFDVRGYGLVLREKLTDKWCCLSCLGAVCEPTIRTEEGHKHSGSSKGKEREWDGRGSGVRGWETSQEEDLWRAPLDFSPLLPNGIDGEHGVYDNQVMSDTMSVGEMMHLRYVKAERQKELGNVAFKRSDFDLAIRHYEAAYMIEPELPHYQLNIAAAHLKLQNWIAAEKACTIVLGQHKSAKAYWRRAKAFKMQDRIDEAESDLRAILNLQPNNTDAINELEILRPPPPPEPSYLASQSPSPGSSTSHTQFQPKQFGSSQIVGPLRLNNQPIPYKVLDADKAKMRFKFLPLTIDESSDGEDDVNTIAYPSWERFAVEKIF